MIEIAAKHDRYLDRLSLSASRLSWASELLFSPTEPGQDPRHVGTVEPMWTLLDLTPGGRPDAYEQIEDEYYKTEAPANSRAE